MEPRGRCAAREHRRSARNGTVAAILERQSVFMVRSVEAAFAIHRITGDESKFCYVVLHADQSVLPFVADMITDPPAQDKYLKLKERICTVLGETSATKLRRLLGLHELGDEKPSIFLQRLRNLAVGQVTDEILKSMFMEQLPENVRTILRSARFRIYRG